MEKNELTPLYPNKLTFSNLQGIFQGARDDHPARNNAPRIVPKSVALQHKKPIEKVYIGNYYYEVKN